MGHLSLEHYGLFQLIRHKGEWIGLDNYSQIFHDRLFWHVVGRTLAFTAAAVSLTMVFGTLIALLLAELGSKMRILLTRRVDLRLGDAGRRRGRRLVVDGRLRVRRPQLAPDVSPRR